MSPETAIDRCPYGCGGVVGHRDSPSCDRPAEPLPPEDMCPNCVTPWKCNGPHLTAPLPPEGPRRFHGDLPTTPTGKGYVANWPEDSGRWAAAVNLVVAIEREAASPAPLDVERLALYMHQARTSNDEPIYDMDEARRRARIVIDRLEARP